MQIAFYNLNCKILELTYENKKERTYFVYIFYEIKIRVPSIHYLKNLINITLEVKHKTEHPKGT